MRLRYEFIEVTFAYLENLDRCNRKRIKQRGS